MGDWFEQASALELLEREHAITAQRARPRPSGPSRIHCLDCEKPIPELRRALGGILRCTPCESISERSNHR